METENAKLKKKLTNLEEEYKKLQDHVSNIELKYQAALLKEGINEEEFRPNEDKLSTKLLKTVSDLFNNRLYSDINMKLEDGSVMYGHKVILASRSTHWGVNNFNRVNMLDFTNITYEVIYDIIKWVYTDEIDLFKYKEEFLTELLEVTLRFQLTSLDIRCQKALISLIDENNCQKLMTLSIELCADLLKKFCKEFMSQAQIEDISGINELQFEEDKMSDDDSLEADNTSSNAGNTSPQAEDGTDNKSHDASKTPFLSDNPSAEVENEANDNEIETIEEVVEIDGEISLEYLPQVYIDSCKTFEDPGNSKEIVQIVENDTHKEQDQKPAEQSDILKPSSENKPEVIIESFRFKAEINPHNDDPIVDEKFNIPILPARPTRKSLKESTITSSADNSTNSSIKTSLGYKSSLRSASKKRIAPIIKGQTCKICCKSYSYPAFRRHMRMHKGERKQKSFKCDVCSKDFRDKTAVENHKRTHSKEKPFGCKDCTGFFKTKSELNSHRKTHDRKLVYNCQICEKIYTHPRSLKKHEKTHSPDNPNICEFCGKSLRDKSSLRDHRRLHTGERPYACDVCGKNFPNNSGYKSHMIKHIGIKAFVCDICGKGYYSNNNLQAHIRLHTGEKPFKCEFCDKRFSSRRHLPRHERSHTGVRPYQCEKCGKAFTDGSSLLAHSKTHSGERPHRCEFCSKTFTQSSHLSKHVKSHLGEKDYECQVCLKRFFHKGHLDRHLRIHTGEKPYSCKVCGKSFARDDYLVKHMTIHLKQNESNHWVDSLCIE